MNTKRTRRMLLLLLCLVFCLAACASSAKKIESDLKKPINCATAEGDIRMLQHEKTHVASQIANGVMAIAPAGIVVGAATGTEGAKVKIATGEYNRMIDKKIAEIKKACGLE